MTDQTTACGWRNKLAADLQSLWLGQAARLVHEPDADVLLRDLASAVPPWEVERFGRESGEQGPGG